jgi:hypothetical protein
MQVLLERLKTHLRNNFAYKKVHQARSVSRHGSVHSLSRGEIFSRDEEWDDWSSGSGPPPVYLVSALT